MNNLLKDSLRKNILFFFLITFICLSFTGTSYAGISKADRDKISADLLVKLTKKYGKPEDVSPKTKMGQMFNSLVVFSKRKDINYRLSIIKNKEVNALTLPDGHVIFFTGLINVLPKDDINPTAFVAAHEISHIERNHIEKKVNQAMMTSAIIGILVDQGGGIVQALGSVANNLLTSGYSRDMETDADMEALSLMKKANYDPNGALTALDILARLDAKSKGTRIFPTHPRSADRYKNVVNWMKSQGIAITDSEGRIQNFKEK